MRYTEKHIDVVWIDNSDKVMAAFELDGGNRKRSVKRLLGVSAFQRIWIYYGNYRRLKDFLNDNDPNQL